MKRLILKKERGSAIVEAPLIILILTMLLMFFIGFSYSYYNKMVMNMAVHEGAREYAVHQNVEEALLAAENELKLGNLTGVTVNFDNSNKHVVATKNIGFFIPITGQYLFNLRSSAGFNKEDDTQYFRKGID